MKRALLASVLDTCGATGALLALRRATSTPWLPIVTFHRVLDARARAPYMLDEDVVDAAPADFERHVRTISRYFTPIGVRDVAAALHGAPLPKNPIVVTFDDGYRDNREVALPILKRYGVKAVFFIATQYLSQRRLFWWDRINYILKRSGRAKLRLSYPWDADYSLASAGDRLRSIRAVLRTVKTYVGLDLERFLDGIASAANVLWNDRIDRELAEAELMTWDQVRELERAGMDVQSHTRTHRVLQTLDAAQLHDELRGSRDDLEGELDMPITSISYPVGHLLEHRNDVRRALREAGYTIGFTNATGTHRMRPGGDPYDVRRIGLDRGTSDSLFRAMLAMPSLFG